MIVTVAFREPYLTHSNKQLDTIEGEKMWWHDSLPTKKGAVTENIVEHFQKSLYGFKPHAIQKAIDRGHDNIIWLDPSVLPTTSLNILYEELLMHPILTVYSHHTMETMCNDKALKYFGITREEAKGIRHVGGTVYGFNFTHPKAVEVFNLWKKAEEDGIFGNQDEFMKGHWADEACMALAMYKCGVENYFPADFKYLNQKNL